MVMIADPKHELWLGDLLIAAGQGSWVHAEGFEIRTMADDADFGNPEPLTVEVASHLFDGDIEEITRFGNREMHFRVRVKATDGEGVAAGEEALLAQLGKPNALKWISPMPFAEPAVFDVTTSWLDFQTVDTNYNNVTLEFLITLRCQPFARSEDEVMVAALDTTPEPVFAVVDSEGSATGWTATVGGVAATPVVSDGVGVTAPILRTNLITTPRFDAATTTGWTTGSSGAELRYGTLRRPQTVVTTFLPGGLPKYELKRLPGALRLVSAYAAVTAGQVYTASIAVASTDVAAGGRWRIYWYTAAGVQVTPNATTVALPANPHGYLTLTATAPAGAVKAQVWLELSGIQVAVSSPLLERASSRGDYFDGSAPSAAGLGYRWAGVPNMSASHQVRLGFIEMTRAGSVDLTATPYLHVDFWASAEDASAITASAGDVQLELTSIIAVSAATWRAVFAAPGSVASSLTFRLDTATGLVPQFFGIRKIQRSDMAQAWVGTGRQKTRTVKVHGTARTQARLALTHPTTGLGETLVYVNRPDGSGYQPPCDQYWVSGGTPTLDGSTSSGRRIALSTGNPAIYDVPMARLSAGDYAFVVRTRATGTAGSRTVTIGATPRVDGVNGRTQSGLWIGQQTAAWDTHPVGNLFSIDPGKHPSGVLRLTVESNALDIENLFLFNVTTGGLVWVECGDYRCLWIDNPMIEHPVPRIFVGNNPDRSDARHVAPGDVDAWDPLYFTPEEAEVFTLSDALDVGASMRHFPRWHTHPRKVVA